MPTDITIVDDMEAIARAAFYIQNKGLCPNCQSRLDPDTAECTNPYRCINGSEED